MKNLIKLILLDTLFTIIDVTLIATFVKMILAGAVAWSILAGVAIMCSVIVQFLVAFAITAGYLRNRIRICVPYCHCPYHDEDEDNEDGYNDGNDEPVEATDSTYDAN